MSAKKGKGDLSKNASAEVGQLSSRNVQSAQPESSIDDGESNWKLERAAMQARLDESQAEVERLRATALAPCPRCDFHPNWTVRVRTMHGQVHAVLCPDGPKTSILRVKQGLAQFNPKFHILQQLALVLPCDESSSSSSSQDADPIDSALADDRTLISCGVSRGDLLELLLVDMVWGDASLAIIEDIKNSGKDYLFNQDEDEDERILAVSWSLVNSINPALSSLRFEEESISAGGIFQICAALRALSTAECIQSGPRISKINFSNQVIDDGGVESCSKLICASTSLQELRLAACHISSQGMVSLVSALHDSTSIQILDLGENEESIGVDGFKAIGAFLCVDSSLKALHLGFNYIDSDGLKAIIDGLRVNRSLQELHLQAIRMDGTAASNLADALRLNSSLRLLNLRRCKIGDNAALVLSAALRENSGLEHLDLGFNQIGDCGASSLCAALRVNSRLHTLDLTSNWIGDSGAAAQGIALVTNSSLTCIQLSNNAISDAGAVALGEALCSNSSMIKLDVEHNKIGSLGAEYLRKAQRENSRLEPMSLKGNPCNK